MAWFVSTRQDYIFPIPIAFFTERKFEFSTVIAPVHLYELWACGIVSMYCLITWKENTKEKGLLTTWREINTQVAENGN